MSGLFMQPKPAAGPDGVREPRPHHSNGINVPTKRQGSAAASSKSYPDRQVRADRATASETHYLSAAIAEISIFTSRGSRATSTVARAGGALLKNVA